jgi:hypothetical protein
MPLLTRVAFIFAQKANEIFIYGGAGIGFIFLQ